MATLTTFQEHHTKGCKKASLLSSLINPIADELQHGRIDVLIDFSVFAGMAGQGGNVYLF